jgi:cell division protein FtsN
MFSRGLATGLLVSALLAVPFLVHSYRRQFGDMLIHLGERLAAKSQAQTQGASPALESVLPVPQPSSPASASLSVSVPEKLLPLPLASPAKPEQRKLEVAPPATAARPTFANDPARKTSGVAPVISSAPSGISLPTTAAGLNSDANLEKIGIVPRPEPANRSGANAEVEIAKEVNAVSNSEKYFEVGKFKDDSLAHNSTDKLKQLGFHATVSQKGHLWMKSYYVLVGPYGVHDDVETARKNLVSRGFKPRVFERGSRSFAFGSGLTLNGTHVPDGDCIISWESYSPDANVEFVKRDSVVATADGKWVKRDVKYWDDAYVYRKNGDGSRTLLEIRFGGMSQALVFGMSSRKLE